MRKIATPFLSIIATMYYGFAVPASSAQTTPIVGVDYAAGEVILTFKSEYMPSVSEISAAPPAVAIAIVDSIFVAIQAHALVKLIPTYDALTTELGQRMERTFLVKYASEDDPMDLRDELLAHPYFEDVTVNTLWWFELAGANRVVPGDTTRFSDQWYFDNDDSGDFSDIDMPEAWSIEQGNPDIVIGIFDSGTMVDRCVLDVGWRLHSDFHYFFLVDEDENNPGMGILNDLDFNLQDDNGDGFIDNVIGTNLAPGCEICPNQPLWRALPQDWLLGETLEDPCVPPQTWGVDGGNDHGTRVGAIAAGRMDGLKKKNPDDVLATHKDIVGAAPSCKVYNVRTGCPLGDFDAARALELLATHCRVVNMSFGQLSRTDFDGGSDNFENAVYTVTREYDCLLVASVGNDSSVTNVIYPARFDSVLAVGGISRYAGESGEQGEPQLVNYSNYSATAHQVDVVAPIETYHDDRAGITTDEHSTGCPPGTPCGFLGPTCSWDETVGLSGDGTSFAAPQVSGVAALVRSRFPELDQFQVKQRIRRAAEYYWSISHGDRPSHEHGYGKVNAYRALTEWGKITANTIWSTGSTRDGKYYISGDLTIESGASLTISPGVVVKIAPDHNEAGVDPTRVKIVVKSGGTLNIVGTSGSQVVFESFTDSAPGQNDWAGIEFEAGSVGTISHAVFKNAGHAIITHVPFAMDNVTIEDGAYGIESYANLTLTNSTLRGLGGNAVVVHAGNLIAQNVEIHDCGGYGISDAAAHGTVQIEECEIHDMGGYGIWLTYPAGAVTIEGTSVERSETTGIVLGNDATVDFCSIRENDIGMSLYGAIDVDVLHTRIDDNTTTGLYLLGYVTATIEADTVTNNTVGVYFDAGSNGLVHGNTLIQGNTGGVKCDNGASPTIRHTRITGSSVGVATLNNAAPDLGDASSGSGCGASGPNCGNNSIYGNTTYNVSNLSMGITIMAEGNWWNGNPPTRFYGSVDRNPWLCGDPNPSAPDDGGDDPGPDEKPGPKLPTHYSLGASKPNPFNPVTTMTFDVPAPGGDVDIAIFDVKGASVRTLVHGRREAGTHSVTWTGGSDSGEPVASGVYFVRMTAPSFTQTRKLVLLK
jgi:hypothetical protein